MKKSKFKIAIVGAGKIASSLTSELVKKYPVEIIISKNINAARQLAKLNSVQKYSTLLNDISSTVNLILLTVHDGQIEPVAKQLSKLKINHSEILFIHFSGSENISALEPLFDKGGKTGSLHIMQTFPSKKNVVIKDCFASVETDDIATSRKIIELAKSIGLKPFIISSEQKTLYHLAGVFTSNFLVGNFFSTQKMFSSKNKNLKVTDLLAPIAKKTLSNIFDGGTVKTLSGPIERGDVKTIQHHLSGMKSKQFYSHEKKLAGLMKMSYVIQSLILLHTAEEKFGKLSAGHKKIQKLLNLELKSFRV